MQAQVHEFLQCIIHKAVLSDARFTNKKWAGDAHPKVCALSAVIGPKVAGVGGALVDHVQK